MTKSLQQLMEKLNYSFQEKKLLKAALTHRSVRGNNNERLEFLGDAALNFIIAEAIYIKFPKVHEGELSRLRASLVKGETLAKLAIGFDLADYLRLGVGELKSGGAQRKSIQADAMEAVIGAIFLDRDFETCRQCVLVWYKDRLNDPKLMEDLRDPKTQLQEYLQSKRFPLPSYQIAKIEGEAHNQTFYIECSVKGLDILSSGKGKSRRKAEQDAAGAFLEALENE